MSSNGQTDRKSFEQPVCHFSSGWNILEYVLFCLALWWLAYWFLIILSRQSKEWCCRVLTIVHGVAITYLSLMDILVNREKLEFQNIPLTNDQKVFLSFMLSYFIFDFLWIHIFGNEPWVIYVHHISSILIIMKLMAIDFGGMVVSYAAAGLEFTNPYLQLRWFLRTHGYHHTKLHTGVEIFLFSTFIAIRLVGGTILFYQVEKYAETDIIMKVSIFTIYAVSLILIGQILLYIKKKYINHIIRTTSESGISAYLQGNHSRIILPESVSQITFNDINEDSSEHSIPVSSVIANNYASISESRVYPTGIITDKEKAPNKKED